MKARETTHYTTRTMSNRYSKGSINITASLKRRRYSAVLAISNFYQDCYEDVHFLLDQGFNNFSHYEAQLFN